MSPTVLIVEDDLDVRETMSMLLEMNGYNVVAAKDGEEGLAELERCGKVDVIFLDLVMPRMTGWQVVERLRADSQLAKIPVVVHSSSDLTPPAGVARVLVKPVQVDQLLATFRELCGR